MKVVCIKECSYSFNLLDYWFNIGEQFELAKFQPTTYYSPGNPDKINIIINFIDGKDYEVTVLKKDFVSLEEWRDNKLKELGI